MCKLIFTYKPQPVLRLHRLFKKMMAPYRIGSDQRSDQSFGLAIQRETSLETLRLSSLPANEDLSDLAKLSLPNKRLMAHVRIECGPGETCVENTHTFFKQSRYLFMHNGSIPLFSCSTTNVEDRNKTDSERFMEAWLSNQGLGLGLESSLLEMVKMVDHQDLLLNMVMVDVETGKTILYSHKNHKSNKNYKTYNTRSETFPSLYIHRRMGLVTNFPVYSAVPIDGLHTL